MVVAGAASTAHMVVASDFISLSPMAVTAYIDMM
jgi:hypothetical protein